MSPPLRPNPALLAAVAASAALVLYAFRSGLSDGYVRGVTRKGERRLTMLPRLGA